MRYGHPRRSFKPHKSAPREAPPEADPARVWAALAHEVRALVVRRGDAPGPMLEARRAAMGAAFPVDGEAPKASANALLEMVRTWTHVGEGQRGWRLQTLDVLAAEVAALVDQHEIGLAQAGRRCAGSDD